MIMLHFIRQIQGSVKMDTGEKRLRVRSFIGKLM